MKKTLLLVLALFMLIVPAFAEEDAKTLEVKCEEEEGYVWTIPESAITITADGVDAKISVSDCILKKDNKLQILVKSEQAHDGKWYLKNSSAELEYSIKKGDTVVASMDNILEITAGTETGEATLTFAKVGSVKRAGVFSDMLVFVASIVEPVTE